MVRAGIPPMKIRLEGGLRRRGVLRGGWIALESLSWLDNEFAVQSVRLNQYFKYR